MPSGVGTGGTEGAAAPPGPRRVGQCPRRPQARSGTREGLLCRLSVLIKSKHQRLKVECLLTSAIWSYGHEAEVYIFLNLPFPSNPKENSSIRCILSTPEQNLLWHIIGCTPNTFHNTINKNVNHSNDTIDNLNQSSFHQPACQCQGHLRTESLSASAHILHCGKIRPWVVRSGFRCASADLRQSRYLHVAR